MICQCSSTTCCSWEQLPHERETFHRGLVTAQMQQVNANKPAAAVNFVFRLFSSLFSRKEWEAQRWTQTHRAGRSYCCWVLADLVDCYFLLNQVFATMLRAQRVNRFSSTNKWSYSRGRQVIGVKPGFLTSNASRGVCKDIEWFRYFPENRNWDQMQTRYEMSSQVIILNFTFVTAIEEHKKFHERKNWTTTRTSTTNSTDTWYNWAVVHSKICARCSQTRSNWIR